MVAADTVVGIVGAVVLVAVMTGVFIYEYNNVDPGPEDPDGSLDTFAAMYPTLNATEDLDGDGTPNNQDDDLDGDGSPNADDNETAVAFERSGSLAPASTGSSVPLEFFVGTGNAASKGTVVIAPTGPALPFPVEEFHVELEHPDGTVEDLGTGTDHTIDLATLDAGTYRLVARNTDQSRGGDVDLAITVHY